MKNVSAGLKAQLPSYKRESVVATLSYAGVRKWLEREGLASFEPNLGMLSGLSVLNSSEESLKLMGIKSPEQRERILEAIDSASAAREFRT